MQRMAKEEPPFCVARRAPSAPATGRGLDPNGLPTHAAVRGLEVAAGAFTLRPLPMELYKKAVAEVEGPPKSRDASNL